MTSLFLRLTLMIAFAASISQAPGSNAAKTPEQAIRNFYHWYMGELIAGGSPMQKKRSEMNQFVTERFLNEIERWNKESEGLGADPFIQSQDVDNEWKSNIVVKNLKTSGSKATARVELKGKGLSQKLSVSLVQEQGAWVVS